VARVKRARGFRVLEQERVQTRLGGGRPGTLPRAAVEETVDAVDRFLRRVRNGRNPRVLAVATSALRDAAGRERVLAAIRRRAGVEVEVLTGRQEAHLAGVAALESLPLRRGLVLDLGGASVELARVRDREIVSTASLPLGTIRLTRRFFRHDPPTGDELRGLRVAVRDALDPALPPAERREVMVGLGGTVRALASIHLRRKGHRRKERHGLVLRQSDVTAIRERLEPLGERKRRKMRGLKPERVDIILAGTMVVEEAMLLGGYLRLVVCTQGVRDAILLRETFHAGASR
jgi:exopolyphosphatase/guanosine-5'-triphosphate,3'-diphosphate pyrophosphatase